MNRRGGMNTLNVKFDDLHDNKAAKTREAQGGEKFWRERGGL